MTSKHAIETFFKSEGYAASFKRSEMVTYRFAEKLVDQSKLAGFKVDHDVFPMVLDNACGTGVISSILNRELDPTIKESWRLTCGDISNEMLKYTNCRREKEGWQNAKTENVDSQATGFPDAHFTHVFTAFGYMAFPKSIQSLDETFRILKPGGTIAFSTWKEPGWVSTTRKVIERMPGSLRFPSFEEVLKAMNDGKWHSASWIENQLRQRGCEEIDVRIEKVNISLDSDLFVEMSLLMLPILTKHFWEEQQSWSEEQQKEHQDKVRTALEEYVKNEMSRDGVVETEWVAILSTARKSS